MFMKYLFILFLFLPPMAFSQGNIDELLAKLRSTPPGRDKLLSYLNISKYYQSGQADSATHYAIEGLKLAIHLNYKQSEAQMLYQMGAINEIHGNLQTAEQHLAEASIIFNRIKDKKGLSDTYRELGIVEGRKGNLKKATDYLMDAIKLCRVTDDQPGTVQCYITLGDILEQNGNWDKALTYYIEAQKLDRRMPLSDTYFTILNNIGNIYLKKGNLFTAIRYFKQGISQSDTSIYAHAHILFLTNSGDAYQKLGDQDNAIKYYKNALVNAIQFELPEAQVKALIKVASVIKETNVNKSLEHLQNALSIARQIPHKKLEAEVYMAMLEIHRQQKHYQNALFILEKQHKLLDSLFIINKTQEIASLQVKYELEKSKNYIEQLQLNSQKRIYERNIGIAVIIAILIILFILIAYFRKTKTINKKLQESNRIKDKLFSIIGHDLRAPIGSLSQMLEILETDDLSPEEQKQIVSDLKKQSEASFEVLSSLLKWGKIQLQGLKVDFTNFQPKNIIDKNILILFNQAKSKSITISNDITNELYVYADSDHFDFIIRNLISNAIKFSYLNGTIEIRSQISSRGDFVIFSVKDYGTGISEIQQQQFLRSNINVSFGTNGETGTGLGLLLSKEFVQSNGGRIWLESEEKKETTFYFSLKKGS